MSEKELKNLGYVLGKVGEIAEIERKILDNTSRHDYYDVPRLAEEALGKKNVSDQVSRILRSPEEFLEIYLDRDSYGQVIHNLIKNGLPALPDNILHNEKVRKKLIEIVLRWRNFFPEELKPGSSISKEDEDWRMKRAIEEYRKNGAQNPNTKKQAQALKLQEFLGLSDDEIERYAEPIEKALASLKPSSSGPKGWW